MSFTKINAAGIGTTETVTVDGLTVINDGSFGGNLTVSGVLTYEDVTNVDSVGLITARNGIVVGSGITLSKDGDIFATGVTTATSFVGSGANLTGVLSDVVEDTSPQLGGNLDVNTKNILFGDSSDGSSDDVLIFGAGSDLSIYHDGSNSFIKNSTGNLRIQDTNGNIQIQAKAGEESIIAKTDGAVELYHDNERKIYTHATGIQVEDATSTGASIVMSTSSGTSGSLYATGDNTLGLLDGQNHYMLKGIKDGAVELYYDNSKKFETLTNGVQITGSEFISEGTILLEKSGAHHHRILSNDTGNDLGFQQSSDTGANTNFTTYLRINDGGNISLPVDNQKLRFGAGADLQIFHDAANSVNIIDGLYHPIELKHGAETHLKCLTDAEVQLYHNNVHMLSTASDGIQFQTDKLITRSPNSNTPIIQVTNAQYAKSIYFGGWEGGVDSSGISRVRNSNDNLHMDCGSLGSMYLNAYANQVIYAKHFRPMTNDTYDLGGNGIRWDDVFATNGTINTSDRNEKNTITESDLGLSFVNKLKPVSYKFNGGTRTHYGLIAQDVETVLSDISKPSTDFAGFIKTDLPDEYYKEAEPNIPEGKKEGDLKSAAHTEYGLRYTEFISPLIKAVQELSARNDALEARIAALEG